MTEEELRREQELEEIRNNGPHSLPNDTKTARLDAEVVKAKLNDPLEILLSKLWEERTRIDSLIEETTKIKNGETIVEKASRDSAGNIISDTYATKNDLETGVVVPLKAQQDKNGNDIANTYETKIEVAKKLTKNTTTGSEKLYGVDSDGSQKMYGVSKQASDDTVGQRDSHGNLKTNNPVNLLDAANKFYVDAIKQALQDQINALVQRGRFLSSWDSSTGMPYTNPTTELPYSYKAGDYFVVDKVAEEEEEGETNYKPNGSSYDGTPSETVETLEVSRNDTYYYDGSSWFLLHQSQILFTWGSIFGDLSSQTDLANALLSKLDKDETADGTPKVYAKDGSGNQQMIRYGSNNTAGTLAYRDSNGNIKVGAASDNADAVNLQTLNAKFNATETNICADGTVITVKVNKVL